MASIQRVPPNGKVLGCVLIGNNQALLLFVEKDWSRNSWEEWTQWIKHHFEWKKTWVLVLALICIVFQWKSHLTSLSPIFSYFKNNIHHASLLGLAWGSNKVMNVKALCKLWRVIQYTWNGSLLLFHHGRWEREEECINMILLTELHSLPSHSPPTHTSSALPLHCESFNLHRFKQTAPRCSCILNHKKDRFSMLVSHPCIIF